MNIDDALNVLVIGDLCEIGITFTDGDTEYINAYYNAGYFEPVEIKDWAGIRSRHGNTLTDFNISSVKQIKKVKKLEIADNFFA